MSSLPFDSIKHKTENRFDLSKKNVRKGMTDDLSEWLQNECLNELLKVVK